MKIITARLLALMLWLPSTTRFVTTAGAVAHPVLLDAARQGWPALDGHGHQLPVVRRITLRELEQPFVARVLFNDSGMVVAAGDVVHRVIRGRPLQTGQ